MRAHYNAACADTCSVSGEIAEFYRSPGRDSRCGGWYCPQHARCCRPIDRTARDVEGAVRTPQRGAGAWSRQAAITHCASPAIDGADLGFADGKAVLDFNFAYNPSCAYSPRWTCPLAPPDNTLPAAVTAGEMAPQAPGA